MTVMRGDESGFTLSPKTLTEEITQNVRMILLSRKYEIPLARDMGIDPNIEGRPIAIAETLAAQSIYDAVEKFEPRARISSVDFEFDSEGHLIPIVEVQPIE